MASSSDDYPCADCEVQSASGSDYGRVHTCGLRRVSHDSIAWERIPEQTLCICAHPKAIHTSGPYAAVMKPNMWTCSASGGCRCPGFHGIDGPMSFGAFSERLIGGWPAPAAISKMRHGPTRARTALLWAWKKSGLNMEQPRVWDLWMHESKRVWQAWRAAGSPIMAFGKKASFGVASIPALEDR